MHRICRLPIAILALPAVAAAQPCPDLAGAARTESEGYVIAYRTRPDRIAPGQHFTMEVVVCPRKSGVGAADHLRVDAHMPEHRHGMNYRTTIKPLEAGRYLAEGFMFHMPGRWEFIFEVRSGGTIERATRSVVLE